MKIQQLTMVDL